MRNLLIFPGIKYVPLRTPGGELIPESGLFLRIKKEDSRRTDPLRRKAGQDGGGAKRGVAQQRRKLTHQRELSGDPVIIQSIIINIAEQFFTHHKPLLSVYIK